MSEPNPADFAEVAERVSMFVEKGKLDSAKKLLEIELLKQQAANGGGRRPLGERMGAKLWEPYTPPPDLIAGVLAKGKIGQIVGYGGSAKTWLALAAGIDVALGSRWLGRFPTVQGPTLYLDWENGSEELRRRVQMYLRGKGLGLERVSAFDAIAMPPIYMDDDAFEDVVAAEVDGVSLCVIDTLKAASPNVEENSSAIRLGIDKLKRVAERTGCAFLLVVHSKKTSGDKNEHDIRESARGSSAIYDATDCALHIQHRFDEPALVRSSKARNGRNFEPFTVALEDTPEGGLLILTGDAPNERDKRKEWAAEREQAIIETLQETPGASLRTIIDALKNQGLGVNRAKIAPLLNSLKINGAIVNRGTDRNQEWHYVLDSASQGKGF